MSNKARQVSEERRPTKGISPLTIEEKEIIFE